MRFLLVSLLFSLTLVANGSAQQPGSVQPPTPPRPPALPAPPAATPWLAQQAPPGPPGPALWLAQSERGGSYLGVGLLEVDEERAAKLGMPEPYGVEISNVAPGSPAEEAGLQRSDVVLKYRGQRIEGVEQFIRLVRETPVGRSAPVTLWRDGSETDLAVTIGQRKASKRHAFWNCEEGDEDCNIQIQVPDLRFHFDIPRPRIVMESRLLGAELEGLEGQLAEYFEVQQGVLVRGVDSTSPASRAGLQAGDVIVSADGRAVREPGDIREAIRESEPEAKVALDVMRKGSKTTLELEAMGRGSDRNRSRSRPIRRTRDNRL